ncbi:MAG: alpha/beta hydrolase [Solobacterium sp.]|nr:alpha/beta hydrolase [Solobacterium sp.]
MIRLTCPKTIRSETVRINGRKTLILRSKKEHSISAGLLWIHGGGYITGMKEMVYASRAVDLVEQFGITVLSVDYRLAPRYPYPAALEDCYAALLYMKENALALNIRSDQIMVGGESAGGGLCAAVCMKARDEKQVNIAYQMPLYPMLNCHDTATSAANHGRIWNTRKNHYAWKQYLKGVDPDHVPVYASPALCRDYSGLPPAYTFVSDGEPFLQETKDYVAQLQEAGIEAHIDIYHGDMHAFDMLDPKSETARKAAEGFNSRFQFALTHYYAKQEEL